jgi:1-acyl-sn-glycerol-3-phosphate acyltransferase
MQRIVIDEPYVPVLPHRGKLWPAILSLYVPYMLRKQHGVSKVTVIHAERVKQSRDAGHGIMLTPNHCRVGDPFVLNSLSRQIGTPSFIMTSWHAFKQSKAQTFFLRRAGAFSIYREGIDRAAVNTAIDMLESAERPLVIFPEGFINRTNDLLKDFMDGTALIARTAAKRRAKLDPPKKVVIHPIALRYKFIGDINGPAGKVLDEIETRLTWARQGGSLYDRISKVGNALLTLKEIEYLGQAGAGPIGPRLTALANSILHPLEEQWVDKRYDDSVPSRVKRLRSAIVPDMTKGDLPEPELARRWKNLSDLYLAEQLYRYPPDYLEDHPTPERILETIERLEEDLTDRVRVHGEIHATVTAGEAIEVSPDRPRGGPDPLMGQIRDQLAALLGSA